MCESKIEDNGMIGGSDRCEIDARMIVIVWDVHKTKKGKKKYRDTSAIHISQECHKVERNIFRGINLIRRTMIKITNLYKEEPACDKDKKAGDPVAREDLPREVNHSVYEEYPSLNDKMSRLINRDTYTIKVQFGPSFPRAQNDPFLLIRERRRGDERMRNSYDRVSTMREEGLYFRAPRSQR